MEVNLSTLALLDGTMFTVIIMLYSILISFAPEDEIPDSEDENVEVKKPRTRTSGSFGKVFNHIDFENTQKEDLD